MIVDESIVVNLNGANKKHYASLGYEIPEKCNVPFAVSSLHIPPSSQVQILRKCDQCGELHRMKRSKYRPVCIKCNSGNMSKARKDISKTTCSKCGSPKSYRSDVCRQCVDMSGENNPMFGRPASEQLLERNRKISENPELHHNWKGGISRDRSGKQISWSKKVKLKYNNVCDCCGYSRQVALEAHHFELTESKKMTNFAVSNGVALCSNCHKEFHKKYGYGNNTKEQYLEFKGSY